MIEPVTATIGLGAIWEFLKHGIEATNLGFEAKQAYHHLLEHFKERLNDDKLPANHDLRLAVEESLLEAARAFALGVNEQLDPKPTLFQAVGSYLKDFDSRRPILDRLKVSGSGWVKELLEESQRAQGSRGIAAEFILDENEATTLLLESAPDKFKQRVTDAFADWLNRRVQDAAKPSCVDGFLTNGWPLEKDGTERINFYEAFALFFREKVKHKDAVFKILIAQTLAEMRQDMKAMREDVKWLREAKTDLTPAAFTELKQTIESLRPTFEQFLKWMDERLARIENLLNEVKVDVGEVKATTHRIESKLDAALKAKRDIPRTHDLRAPVLLFGRDEDMKFLLDGIARQRAASVAISGVHGLGGVGKTELALTLAQRLTPQFPDAQIMLDLRGFDPDKRAPLTTEEVLAQIILAFKPEGKLPEDRATLQAAYRSVLSQAGRVLLVFDNAFSATQVEPAVPPPNGLLLITSRNHFVLPGRPMVTRDLNSLLPAQSQAMLLDRAPRLGGQAADAAKLCGHLPLPLRTFADAVVGNRLTPVADLIARLAAHAADLSPQDAAFQTSYDLLSAPLQTRWLVLAVFAGDFDLRAAQAVWNETSRETALAAMQSLVDASLVEFDERKVRFHLHDLVRDFCLRKADAAVMEVACLAHARHYTAVGKEADKLYMTKGKHVDGLALFDRERVQIEAAYAWLAAQMERGVHAASASEPERTLKRAEARAPQYAARQMIALVDAVVYTGNLRFHPRQRIAWLESQLRAARIVKHREAEGVALGNLGNAHAALGDARKAIEYHEQALAVSREIGDRCGEGNDLMNLGNAHYFLGDARKAIEFHGQALPVFREIGDRRGESAALGNLGLAHAALGDSRKASEFYEQQLVIAREIGDRRGEGNALGNLGNAHADLGDSRKASEFYEQQLVIARESSDRRGEVNALGNLGSAHYSLGDAHKAVEFYEQQLVMAREIGGRRGEGNALINSALAHDTLGNRAEAIARAGAALKIFEAIEDPNAAKVRAQLAEWRGQA